MFSFHSKSNNNKVAGISLHEHGISLAITDHSKKQPTLEHANFYPCSLLEQANVLARLSKEHQLYDTVCNLVLDSSEYQFHQVDAPDVPKHELDSALRWQVKDLIDFHIDDAIIDKIELPEHSPISQGKYSLLVIASRQSLIQAHVNLLQTANCNLATIDIAALASRNIVSHMSTVNKDSSIGLLSLWDDMAKISVFLNHDLYINRSSTTGLQDLDSVSADNVISQSILDSLTLELQRTFDYYESHSRHVAISHLYILSNGKPLPNIAPLIEQRLGIGCSVIKLSDFITYPGTLDEAVANSCMMAIGGALRMEY